MEIWGDSAQEIWQETTTTQGCVRQSILNDSLLSITLQRGVTVTPFYSQVWKVKLRGLAEVTATDLCMQTCVQYPVVSGRMLA
jgi:hypothetical protein